MAIRPWGVCSGLLALTLTLTAPALADDELSYHWGGRVQSDLRFRTERKGVGDYYGRVEVPDGPERNQNTIGLNLDASYGKFKAVGQINFVLDSFSNDIQNVADLYRIDKIEPYYFEAPALYLDIKDLFINGLDLRIGQQIVSWGVGDQFNPTNNLNPDDLRDPLLFGRQAGNFMVKSDYWINDDWSVSGVMVPVFRPAMLPRTAVLAPAALDRLPFTDPAFRHRIEAEQATSQAYFGSPTVVSSATPVLPETSLANMQWAYRLAGTIAEQNVALSYYYGFHDFPVPLANHTRLDKTPQCDPKDKTKCIQGLLKTDVKLGYTKMHAYGLNASGEIPLSWLKESLHGIGYRFEAALVVPDGNTTKLTQDALDFDLLPQPAGEYDYNGSAPGTGKPPSTVDHTAFLKWVIGLDYTLGEHVYVNAQWVHGLIDEFGAGDFLHEGWAVRKSNVISKQFNPDSNVDTLACARPPAAQPGKAQVAPGEQCARELLRPILGDYVVLGVDFKFLNNALLLRVFNIVDVSGIVEEKWDPEQQKRVRTSFSPFSEEGFSMVIYPELNYNFGNGLELAAGALVQLGQDYTKFGSAEAGGTLVWTRGRFSF